MKVKVLRRNIDRIKVLIGKNVGKDEPYRRISKPAHLAPLSMPGRTKP